MKLRPYQREAGDRIAESWLDHTASMVVMPTGTGKTILFADIVRRRFPRRAMVVAHRQELIHQARQKIIAVTGLAVEVEMGTYRANNQSGLFQRSRPTVVVSSIQTLTSGGDGGGRMGKFNPTEFGTLIIDEAHHATSPSYRRFIDYCRFNPDLKILGVTATPDRADEEALGQVFDNVAYDYEILDAINDGWLVPIEQQMVEVADLDFSGVKTTAGDLNGSDLAAIMEQEESLHGVAGPTIEIAGDRKTLVFTASIKHAQVLCAILNRHKPGLAAWVCGKTDDLERREINDKFHKGHYQFLCNCGTHTEGFDSPGVEVVAMARPTKSRALYAQMVGRSTRPLPGVVDGEDLETPESRKLAILSSAKPSCLVIDFVGNAGKHKLMTTADILGGRVSDEAVESAIIRARKSGQPVRMDKALEDEELEVKEREQRRLAEEARKARLVAKAKYSKTKVDPFELLDLKPEKSRGWDQGKVFTERQREMLKKNKVDPDKIEYARGKQLIGELVRRWRENLATIGQVKLLKKFGYDARNMRFDAAKAVIGKVAKNGWRRPKKPPVPPDRKTVSALTENSPNSNGSEYKQTKLVSALTELHRPIEDDDIPF